MLRRMIQLTATSGALGLMLVLLSPQPAQARSFERCDRDGKECVTIHCDQDITQCWNESPYANEAAYHGLGHWVCVKGQERCHWQYDVIPWYHRWFFPWLW